MRIFDHFPQTGECPICHTKEEGQCMLIPLYGSFDEQGIGNGLPFHVKCLNLLFYQNGKIIAQVVP